MAIQRRQSKERGMAIIFFATMLFFVVGAVGLAVDVGTIYMIKARLGSAVDAAALAAGRSVNLANTVAQANTNATNTANQFFAANFPTGYFNSIGTPVVAPTFTQQREPERRAGHRRHGDRLRPNLFHEYLQHPQYPGQVHGHGQPSRAGIDVGTRSIQFYGLRRR